MSDGNCLTHNSELALLPQAKNKHHETSFRSKERLLLPQLDLRLWPRFQSGKIIASKCTNPRDHISQAETSLVHVPSSMDQVSNVDTEVGEEGEHTA